MKLINAFLLVLVLFVVGYSQTQTKCFFNAGLKDEHKISLTINGRSVTGEFLVEREYSEQLTETYPFTGTISGVNMTVKFASGKVPDGFLPKKASFLWTLMTKGDVQTLKVTLYGRKSGGNYSTYTADYQSCEPSYGTLRLAAKRVSFAKGSALATVPVTMAAMRDRRSFLLNLRKGQRLSVSAIGCGISYFNPDKSPYDEGTAIDTWASDALPQSGDYLFVISPAGVPGMCSVIFKTK